MDRQILGLLVPIVFFLCAAIVISLALYLNYRKRVRGIEAMRAVLEREANVNPQALTLLGAEAKPPAADLRRALTYFSLAAGAIVFSFYMPDEDITVLSRGLAGFPAALGAAHLFLYLRFSGRSRSG